MLKAIVLWTSVGIGGFSIACSSSTSAVGSVRSPLRDEMQHVLEMRAPRYAGNGEKADALRFVKTDLIAWTVQRGDASDSLIKKYEIARSDASSTGRSAFFRDVATLQLDFCREFIMAGASAAPRSIRADPHLYDTYVGALAGVVETRLDQAIREADACMASAPRTESATAADCRKMRLEASKLREQVGPTVQALDGATPL